MRPELAESTGWLITGFQMMVAIALWTVGVLAYGLFWRSMARSEPDPIRPSGPLED